MGTGKKTGKGTTAQVAAAYSPKFLALKQILLDAGDGSALKKIGEMGIIHPNVLQNFGLTYPASAMEINLEDFVSLM